MQSGRVFNGRPRRLLCTQSLSMGAAPPAPASASPAAAPATPAAAGAPPQPQRRLKSSSLMTWRQVGKQGTEKQGVGRPQGFVLPAVPLSQSAQHTRPPACQPACPPARPVTHLCGQPLDLLCCHAGAVPHHLIQLAIVCTGRGGRHAGMFHGQASQADRCSRCSGLGIGPTAAVAAAR
jgi:hypothetical protein